MKETESKLIDLFIVEKRPISLREAVPLFKKTFHLPISKSAIAKVCEKYEDFLFFEEGSESCFLTKHMYTAIKAVERVKKEGYVNLFYERFLDLYPSKAHYEKAEQYIDKVLDAYRIDHVYFVDPETEHVEDDCSEQAKKKMKLQEVFAKIRAKLEEAPEGEPVKWSRKVIGNLLEDSCPEKLSEALEAAGFCCLEEDLKNEEAAILPVYLKKKEEEKEEVTEPEDDETEEELPELAGAIEDEPEPEPEPEPVVTQEQLDFENFLQNTLRRMNEGEEKIGMSAFFIARIVQDLDPEWVSQKYEEFNLSIEIDQEEGEALIFRK
ncbi:MAG: hypothetical protein MI784_15550 [Cytophagales bacterium]|nr:hypothetical protein [Cytophagales bacterium]